MIPLGYYVTKEGFEGCIPCRSLEGKGEEEDGTEQSYAESKNRDIQLGKGKESSPLSSPET